MVLEQLFKRPCSCPNERVLAVREDMTFARTSATYDGGGVAERVGKQRVCAAVCSKPSIRTRSGSLRRSDDPPTTTRGRRHERREAETTYAKRRATIKDTMAPTL